MLASVIVSRSWNFDPYSGNPAGWRDPRLVFAETRTWAGLVVAGGTCHLTTPLSADWMLIRLWNVLAAVSKERRTRIGEYCLRQNQRAE